MAKNEKSKDYTVGGGKKWLAIFAMLALIAIVVVVVLSVIPPSTNKAVNLLKEVSTTSYMTGDAEKTEFDSFETKVANTSKINDYIKKLPEEMKDVQNITYSISYVLDYYNGNMMFANKGNAFAKNYKSIMNGLNGAVRSQIELNALMEEINELGNSSATYLQNAWTEYREAFTDWLGHNAKAIKGLKNAYQGGMGYATNNNLASTLVLNTISDYLDVIYEDFKALVTKDQLKPSASNYEYVSKGKITAFHDFVATKLKVNDDIKDYYFKANVRAEYELLNSFFELYLENDLTNVISSIKYVNSNCVVTNTYEEVSDTKNVYDKIKIFVVGD